MNSDLQTEHQPQIDVRIAKLFFEEHKNTAEIAAWIGWHEAAVDRSLSATLTAMATLRRGRR